MGKLPEDLRVALEGLSLLNEKFLVPLGRLDRIIRTCAESYDRIADAEKALEKLRQETAEAQRLASQHAQRSQDRLKVLADELLALQAKWKQEENAQEEKRAVAQQRLEALEANCLSKRHELDSIIKTIEDETKRLEELRERIRRAQTMEP